MERRIVFNTWTGACFNPGGGEVQLFNTKAALEKTGYRIEFFDQWHPQRNVDLLHQFSIQLGTNFVVNEYKDLGTKIAIAPILWADFPKDHFMYGQVRENLLKADILFTNSDAESLKLSTWFEIAIPKFHKTRNSITSDFMTLGAPQMFRDKFKIDGDFVLSIANIDRRKNTMALVEACKHLQLKLVLIGAVRDRGYFEEFKHAYSDLIYLGPIADPQIIKSACRACRVFALPSLCETPGIAALEAASQGARIVITNEGPTQEYFGDHAIYVSPFDQTALVAALLEGMETKASVAQVRFICERYTWEQTASEVAEGYRKILPKPTQSAQPKT